MRRDLMEILVCPVCKSKLTLDIEQVETLDQGHEEIIDGHLNCIACDHAYLIENGIPNLLPPELDKTEDTNKVTAS